MADDVYPADLPTTLGSLLLHCHSLDVRRAGRGGRHVSRIALEHDAAAVKHGHRSDLADDAIATLVWAACTTDADAHCKGAQAYKVTATYAKPRSGPPPEPRSIDLQVGEPDEKAVERHQRDTVLAEVMANSREVFKQHLALLDQTTKLAKAVGDMATGLAGAFSQVWQREAAIATATTEAKFIDAEQASERTRMGMLEKLLTQGLSLARAKLGIAVDDDKALPESPSKLVRTARAFGAGLTAATLAKAREVLGSDADLAALRVVSDEPETLAILARFYAHDVSNLMALYETLTPSLQSLAADLQDMAAKAGEQHAVS